MRGAELDTFRLARAIHEVKRDGHFLVELPRMAQDERLDEPSRRRATHTYAALLFRGGGTWDSVDAAVTALKIPEATKVWWQKLKAEERR